MQKTSEAVLGGSLFAGIVLPALLGFVLFEDALLGHFTYAEALFLSLALTFIFYSSTLFYMAVVGMDALKTDYEQLYAALIVTALSFSIDLGYCYFFGLSLNVFLTALICLYTFFMLCFLFAKVREIQE